jgi:hypothetical protein
MSTPTTAPPAVEPVTTRQVMERFPTTPVWFGPYTGNWWALAGDRLIEAPSPEELGELLAARSGTPRRPVGSWLPAA